MVEIILHQIPGTKIQRSRGEEIQVVGQEAEAQLRLDLRIAIYDAIPKGGITPEAVFDVVMSEPKFTTPSSLAPHQFFLGIVSLMDAGFITASIRRVAAA